MPILKEITTESGASAGIHAITHLMFTVLDGELICQATLGSWPNQTRYEAGTEEMTRHVLLVEVEPSGTMFADAEAAIIAGESDWAGGTYIDTAPVTTLELAKEHRRSKMKSIRNHIEFNDGFFRGLQPFDSDLHSQSKLHAAIHRARAAIEGSETSWETELTMRDGSTITVDAEDVLEIGSALFETIESLDATLRGLYDDIDSSTTVEEVEAITWP